MGLPCLKRRCVILYVDQILNFFLKGFLIGLCIAAPVGPIGLLCIQRTLNHGRLSGLFTGLGAATADACYGAIAAYGLTHISNFLIGQKFWFKSIGGLFLVYLGYITFISKPAQQSTVNNHKGLLPDYFSTVLLTATNPTTILSFVAVFAGLGLGSTNNDNVSATLMVLGVFMGSALWWLILSVSVSLAKQKISTSTLEAINRTSGIVILVFGALALLSLLNQ